MPATIPSTRARPTRERILDAADRLFGERGFRGTSLRALTSEAGVNLAAVNYHFGSKHELLHAAVARHLEPINRKRLALLDELERKAPDGRVPVEQILEALFRPVVDFRHASAQNSDVVRRVAALIHAEPREVVVPLVQELFGEVTERFTAALSRALPELSEDEVALRFHVCVGSMVHVLGRVPPHELGLSDDESAEQLVNFLAAGFGRGRAS